jgi:hypothetical protein
MREHFKLLGLGGRALDYTDIPVLSGNMIRGGERKSSLEIEVVANNAIFADLPRVRARIEPDLMPDAS